MKTLYSQDWCQLTDDNTVVYPGSIHIKQDGRIIISVEDDAFNGYFDKNQAKEIYNVLRQVFEFKKKENTP